MSPARLTASATGIEAHYRFQMLGTKIYYTLDAERLSNEAVEARASFAITEAPSPSQMQGHPGVTRLFNRLEYGGCGQNKEIRKDLGKFIGFEVWEISRGVGVVREKYHDAVYANCAVIASKKLVEAKNGNQEYTESALEWTSSVKLCDWSHLFVPVDALWSPFLEKNVKKCTIGLVSL